MNFFPRHSLKSIEERITILALYGSGVYTSQDSDSRTFLAISDKIIKDYNEEKLWQQQLLMALCKVNRRGAKRR